MQFHTTGIVLAALTVVSAARAQTTQAVEWKVSEGGNGHWYLAGNALMTRPEAVALAASRNAYLATAVTAAENAFLTQQGFPSDGTFAYWFGAIRADAGSGAWSWITGEPWDYSNFDASEPNGCCGIDVRYGVFRTHSQHEGRWDDTSYESRNRVLLEWSADCNADGIVDYGQILHGELDDDNTNGIPDVCETSVTGVIPPSIPSQGGATVTIKGANFPDHPTVLIGGVAATDVVRLSATRITATSPALLPGMASISVNGFTLPEALYIRPECGSDLDQNGTVDTGDISIILLDFGPCYEPPAVLAAPAPTPLLGDEPAQKPVHR